VCKDHVEIAVAPDGEIRIHHDTLWVDPLLLKLYPPPPPQAQIPCEPLPSAAPIRACCLNSLIINNPCVDSQSYSRDGVINGAIHPSSLQVTINVGMISPSGWSPWLILATYCKWNVSWLAVEEPHTTKNENGIRMVSPNQVTPSWLRLYGVSLLLSDSRLPPLGQQLWTEASPLWADVGCRPPRRLGKPSKYWTSSILPCNHDLQGGLSAVFGKLHIVTRTINGWYTSWSFPRIP
jgi:hypothetical protein